MRFRLVFNIVLIFIFALSAEANAQNVQQRLKGMVNSAKERINCATGPVVRNVANAASALNASMNYTLGFADKCWTDSNGASIVTCDEIRQVDRTGFISHYDYDPDPTGTSKNHRTCTIPEAARILEDLMVSDLAKEVEDSIGCQLPFLDDFVDKPSSTTVQDFQARAFEAYKNAMSDLQKFIPERDRLQHEADFGSGVCRGPAKEGYDPQMTPACKAYRSQAGQAGAARAAELTTKIELLVNSIPLANDPKVHAAVLKMATAGTSTQAAFLGGYRKPVGEIRKDAASLKAMLKEAKTEEGDQYNIEPLLRAQLLGIPNYKEFVNSRTKLPPKIRNILTCVQDARGKGATRATIINFSAAAASIALTGGAAAGVVALGEGATAGLIALDLGVATLGNVQTIDAIYNSCYNHIESFKPGQQCSVEQSMNFTVGRADRAACALNVGVVAAPTVLAGASLAGKAVLRTAAADARLAGNAESAAENVAESAVEMGLPATERVATSVAPTADRRVAPRGRRTSDIENRTGIESSQGLRERFSPGAARTRRRQELVNGFEEKLFTSPKENREYIEAAVTMSPDDEVTFMIEENAILKQMNDTLKDKSLSTSITNLRLHFLNRRLRMLGVHMPDVSKLKYSDFKSAQAAWLAKLTPAERAKVTQARQLAKQDFAEELERLKIVRAGDNIADGFRAGMGRTADEAASTARVARDLPDDRVWDYNDPEVRTIMEDNLRQAHGTRSALTDRPSVQNFLERTADGHIIPTREAFDLMRKNQTPEAFLQAVRTRYKDSKMTLDDARDLTASHHFADKFNPSILNETREVVSLTKAKHGGMSADFCGLGSANTHGTAGAIACAVTRDQAVKGARVAEQKVTEEFRRKIARYKKLMGDAAKCSGDDCVTVAQGRAWTRAEKQDRLNRLNSDPLTRDMRIGFVGDKVIREEDINQLATHAESIEKLMRGHFEGKIPYSRSKDMTFAVDMDSKALGEGSASWLSGVNGKPMTAEEKRVVEEAFAAAVRDINSSLVKKGERGTYQVAP